ncbi:glycosyltransferase family 2 protein [Collimonas sp.]|jgi:glycosyltransferase involved in cell wall biosynthesis|uniref:glycosyltransferase family 2 protein n=1 Tax=Collimonas sp. TaxID=1963772 RepID=UPI002BC5CB07|nr:glycosyltransferase family 2 protein [Collimonas sp.]HWW05536.1 glycosyltransferase family 2 protein [Collimonas sp.]
MHVNSRDQASDQPLLSLVVPFYNESSAVAHFFQRITPVLAALDTLSYEIVCINDGSADDTLAQLIAIAERDNRVRVIDLSRNFGKEAALTAGLNEALGDAVIPIDADLQDPPELIPRLIEQWRNGYEVVLARRVNRDSDSFLKRKTAQLFYRLYNAVSDIKLPDNVGDFRLIDRQVLEALKQLPENRRFMKGLFAWVGFKTATVEYVREARSAGESKFSGWRLWNFALEGITSFSTVPLRWWTYCGSAISLFAFIYGLVTIIKTLIRGIDMPGYASILTVVLFLGGIQLIGIGVLGEYLGRTYLESKGRPVYLIRRRYQKTED